MKMTLSLAAVIVLAAVSTGAQGIGGGVMTGPTSFHTLPWTPPAHPNAVDVTGDAMYLPSTFVSFDRAVAVGKEDLKEEAKTVAEAAADSRKRAHATASIRVAQDNKGRLVVAKK
jgi:hypothetical protein